jgi:hypothetical protein
MVTKLLPRFSVLARLPSGGGVHPASADLLGPAGCINGGRKSAAGQSKFGANPLFLCDAVATLTAADATEAVCANPAVSDFIRDAFGHLKFIGYPSGIANFGKGGIADNLDDACCGWGALNPSTTSPLPVANCVPESAKKWFHIDMNDPLAAYLHDHLAGSSFAVELLEKLRAEFTGAPSGEVARELLEQVQTDRQTLEQLIAKVGKANPDLYDALGWIAERISRIKLKHDNPSGIGAFEAFETISLGILGKRALWEALQTYQSVDSRIAGFDYAALIARAEQQYQTANQYRLELTRSALSS